MHKYLVTILLSGMLASPALALAKDGGLLNRVANADLKTAAGFPPPAKDEGSIDRVANAFFSQKDAKIIRDYYEALNKKKQEQEHKAKEKGLPPGLAKREQLPPGLQQHLERHGKLPPGLEKKRLPGDLNKRLSPVPKGYKRLTVGRDVVLVDERTQVIVDILTDVLTGDL